jgi:Ca2+-binding RTX toxin-like protein
VVSELGGSGNFDLVQATVDFTLPDGVEELELYGTAIRGTGNSLGNFIQGNREHNLLSGMGGNDELEGQAGRDRLNGGTGNDTLMGGTGNDRLAGGTGRDAFLFDSRLNATSNVDAITGFVAADDTILLDNAIFTRFATADVALSAANFKANAAGAATDRNDYIVYQTDTGKLFYDADGNGAGAAVHFATLVGAPAITAADFFVV